jgi:two-component system phosphate regulon sensor histidine kinase PhoR
MKKKLILTSILSVFLSLLTLLLVSVLLVDSSQKKDAERSLRNYLSVATSFYDADSSTNTAEATKDLLANSYSDVRLTIIASDGTVKIDTAPDVNENHLNRPEILSPGSVVYRYSATLHQKMIYLAGKDVGSAGTTDYVRLAFSVDSVEKTTYSLLGYGLGGILLITTLSGFLTAYLTNRSLKPLKKEVASLSEMVGEEANPKDDVKELGEKVAKAKLLLADEVKEIQQEKTKYESLLDEMEQGLLALDKEGKIRILNKAAALLFLSTKEALLGQPYRVLANDEGVMKRIEGALKEGVSSSYDYDTGKGIYLLSFSPLGTKEAPGDFLGAAVLSLDVTEKRKLERTKRDFFANASHELKSPLTAIIGYLELLENGTIEQEKDKEKAIATTLFEARRMKEIIAEMLTLSKLEGENEKKLVDVDLKKVTLDALKEQEGLLQEKKIHLQLDLKEVSFAMEEIDAENLIHNLLENGIKYNKDGGTLTVRLNPEAFVVEDTGIGIAPENQSRIYERFYRIDPALSKRLGGTGLGLSIVKHICLDYGFNITLSSTLGKGSTFSVFFCKAPIK